MKIYCSREQNPYSLDKYVGKGVWVLAYITGMYKVHGRKIGNAPYYIRIDGKSPIPNVDGSGIYNYFITAVEEYSVMTWNKYSDYDVNMLTDLFYNYAVPENKLSIMSTETYTTQEIKEFLKEHSV